MMKILAVLMAFCLVLTGCAAAAVPSPEAVALALAKPFTAQVSILYGDGEARGELSFSPAETVLKVTGPEELTGLTVTLNADGEALAYAGMEKLLPGGSLPKTAPVRLLSEALQSAARGEGLETELDGELVEAWGRSGSGQFVLTLDTQTLEPLELRIPAAELSVKFGADGA